MKQCKQLQTAKFQLIWGILATLYLLSFKLRAPNSMFQTAYINTFLLLEYIFMWNKNGKVCWINYDKLGETSFAFFVGLMNEMWNVW